MKKFALLLTALTLLLALTACGGEKPAAPAPQEAPSTEEMVEVQTFTGILSEKKDFMLIVDGEEEGGDAYIFNLEEGVSCDAEEGDKITITYSGDIHDFDAQLLASAVEKAE